MNEYFTNYPKEPIGGGNPYWRCVLCKRSDPEINGRLEGHNSDCKYRIKQQRKQDAKRHTTKS